VISVQSTKSEDLFDEGDLRILNTIAANIGTAIRNVSLFDEIKRQKQYYQAVIENSPAAIVLLDMNANVTGWNPAAEKLFGYTEREALGHNIDDLIAQTETLHAEANEYSQRVLTEKYIHRIVQRTRKDGSLVDVEVSALPVTVDGNQVDFIAIYHDITELQHARQAAEEANQAKSVFLANMSHELRTPLNAIIGFTRIVKRKGEDVLPEKQVDNLDKVLVSADHLLGLINSVLDISKIEAGRMEVVSESFDFASLADQILSTTQPLVKETVELSSEIPSDLPQLHTDQDKLKQILINLLSNAAKFTHQGQIILNAQSVDSMLMVEVQDTGIGISPKALGTIFEEFQQADTSTTREYGGTGLGLTISKRLAQLLGGDLSASSVEGEGSIFLLSIPLYCCETPRPEQLLPVTAEKYPEKSDQPLILSIDDDPNIHDLLKENLTGHGYQVFGVLNGEDGLRMARQLKPIVIILDIMMPGMNGWQVLHELKSDPVTVDIPVIMVTIMDKQAFGYQLGATDYLVKPLKEDALLSSLHRIRSQIHTSSKLRLLVIDDDPNISDIIRQILVDTPYQVESAFDGQSGLDAILYQPPDVILLDLMMPDIDGFSLIESLSEKGLSIPIIVLTSMTLGTADLEILEGNVEQIIHKNGLERDKLLSKLYNTLEAVRLNMDEVIL
jgi:PAS domain S-box-containing protein